MFSTTSAEDIIYRIKNNIEDFDLNKEGTDVRQNQPDILDVREHYNKNYLKFRNWYNSSNRNIIDLFTLTFYSFSNLIRFNQKSDFNMPYGNRCFTSEHEKIIRECCESLKQKNIVLYNLDYREVLNNEELSEKDFVYCDCPYSQTTAIYNEKRAFGGWDISSDYEMFKCLEELNSKNIKWGLSNVFCNKGKTNQHLIDWCEKNNWNVYHLNKTYSALGKGNAKSDEVYICNYRIE